MHITRMKVNLNKQYQKLVRTFTLASLGPNEIGFDTSSSWTLPNLNTLTNFHVSFVKCSIGCGSLHFNRGLGISLPQRPLNPVLEKLTLRKIGTVHKIYYFATETSMGHIFFYSGFKVHSKTSLVQKLLKLTKAV